MSEEIVLKRWKETRDLAGTAVTFKSRQVVDTVGYEMLDYLGTFTDEPGDYTICRVQDKDGYVFYLHPLPEPEYPREEDFESKETYESAVDAYDAWQENQWETRHVQGRSAHHRGAYRYFVPARVPDPEVVEKEFQGVSHAWKQELVRTYGSLVETQIRYAVDDWQRVESYLLGEWYMTGVVTEMWIGDWLYGSESLWGIESDVDEHYPRDVSRDLVTSLLARFQRDGVHVLADQFAQLGQIAGAYRDLQIAA